MEKKVILGSSYFLLWAFSLHIFISKKGLIPLASHVPAEAIQCLAGPHSTNDTHCNYFKIFILFITGCTGSSLLCTAWEGGASVVAESGGYSLVLVRGLLIATASLTAQCRL